MEETRRSFEEAFDELSDPKRCKSLHKMYRCFGRDAVRDSLRSRKLARHPTLGRSQAELAQAISLARERSPSYGTFGRVFATLDAE